MDRFTVGVLHHYGLDHHICDNYLPLCERPGQVTFIKPKFSLSEYPDRKGICPSCLQRYRRIPKKNTAKTKSHSIGNTSSEVKLIPIKSCRTWVRPPQSCLTNFWSKKKKKIKKQSKSGPIRGLSFSLYKYTLLHTDLIPTGIRKGFKCVCGKEDFLSKIQAVAHVRGNHLQDMGAGVKEQSILDEYITPTSSMSSEEKRLCIDLGNYKIVIASPNGSITELIVDDLELAEKIMACRTEKEVDSLTSKSMKGLIKISEDFEDKISQTCASYLGTPKESDGFTQGELQ